MGFTRPQSGRTFARLPEVHKVEVAVRKTGVLTAGRNPGGRTDPVCQLLTTEGNNVTFQRAIIPRQGREVFGDFHRCSRQPEDAGIAGLGHELTLLPE